MVTLTYLSAIRFSGTDASQFLHNQLSADILALANGESVFACYCEPKGRVLALMLVCKIDADYFVLMSRPLVAAIADRLKIYVMRSKVNIEVLSEHTVSGFDSDEAPQTALASEYAIPVPAGSFWLLVSNREPGPATDVALCDAWKTSELNRGITWLCPETSGQFLPQMLGFDQLGAVNYRKGCYPGQEIVARTHYLGKVKRHPRLVCTGAKICPDPLDKIQIFSGDQDFEAVITDCSQNEAGGACLFTITRMDPDLPAEKIEFQGQLAAVI